MGAYPDTMPTPEAREWREAITKEVNRLRKQFLFVFALLIATVVLFGAQQVNADRQLQTVVDQIREDRYSGCLQRIEQLVAYNSHVEVALINILEAANVASESRERLKVQLGLDLQFPLPNCPPDPSP